MNKKYEVAVNLQQDFTAAEQTQGRNNIGACDTANIAPAYTNKTYDANSYVMHDGVLYTNENAIETAEDWNPAHWTQTTVAEMMAGVKVAYTPKSMEAMAGGAYNIPTKNRECITIPSIGYSGVSLANRYVRIALADDCTDAVINILSIELGTMKSQGWSFIATRGNKTLPIYGFGNYSNFDVTHDMSDVNVLVSTINGGSEWEVPDSFDGVGLDQVVKDIDVEKFELRATATAVCFEVKGDCVIVRQIAGTGF